MAGTVSVEWEGLDTLIGTIRQISPRATTFLRSSMWDLMSEAFEQSQVEVPVATGTLKGSGSVDIISDDPIEITIGYGGAAAGYALWVHENLAARHKAPTKAKFVEDPVNRMMSQLTTRMEGRIEAAILGQYPQQASIAQGSEMATAVKTATGRGSRAHAAHRAAVARSKALSPLQIKQALRDIDRAHSEAVSTGKPLRRTWHRSR